MVLAIVRQDARRIMGRWGFLASVILAAGMVLYALFANCISLTLGQSALAAQPSLLFASPPSDLNGAFLPPDVLCATGMCQLGYAWLLLPILCGSVIGDDFKNGYVLVRRVHGASDRCVRIGQTIAALLSATLYFMLTAAIVFLCCAGVSVARGDAGYYRDLYDALSMPQGSLVYGDRLLYVRDLAVAWFATLGVAAISVAMSRVVRLRALGLTSGVVLMALSNVVAVQDVVSGFQQAVSSLLPIPPSVAYSLDPLLYVRGLPYAGMPTNMSADQAIVVVLWITLAVLFIWGVSAFARRFERRA